MNETYSKGKGFRSLLRRLCFVVFGICAFSNPLDRWNLYYILFGSVVGLAFGWLFGKFLRGFLSLFNGKFKKEKGETVVRYTVETGMLFLTPFAIMLLLATFYLRWNMTVAFISAAIMAVGTASSIEFGKAKGKQEIKNTIATTVVSGLFSLLWTVAYPFLVKVPAYLEGGVNLLLSLTKGGGV